MHARSLWISVTVLTTTIFCSAIAAGDWTGDKKAPDPVAGCGTGPTEQMRAMAWLSGRWTVTTKYCAPGGQVFSNQTESTIEPMLDGSFLQERLSVPSGKDSKTSLIGIRSYDRFRKVYRVVWFDDTVTLADVYEGLEMEGGLTVSNVKPGTSVTLPGSPETFVRITQKRGTDTNSFSLTWDASTDAGKTWRKTSEYLYARKP